MDGQSEEFHLRRHEERAFPGVQEQINDDPLTVLWGAAISVGLLTIIILFDLQGRDTPPQMETGGRGSG